MTVFFGGVDARLQIFAFPFGENIIVGHVLLVELLHITVAADLHKIGVK